MMDIFSNPAVIWFIVGFILFVLEFIVPGLVLFFFALGAWLVAGLTLGFDLSFNQQLTLFLGSSVVFLILLRKALKNKMWFNRVANEEIEEEFIGRTAKADTEIAPGSDGKVLFKGTTWPASSSEVIQKGQNVIIIGKESIHLKVKSIQNN